jgi:hypothetical protein
VNVGSVVRVRHLNDLHDVGSSLPYKEGGGLLGDHDFLSCASEVAASRSGSELAVSMDRPGRIRSLNMRREPAIALGS